MAKIELGKGPLLFPKTSMSWRGTAVSDLSFFFEENFGRVEIIASRAFDPWSFEFEFGRSNDMMYHSAKYGGKFGLVPKDEVEGFFFKFPRKGGSLLNIGIDDFVVRSGEAVAFRAEYLRQLKFENDFQESQISFVSSYCIERLSILIDRPVVKPLVFTPKVSLTSNSLAKFATLAHFLCVSDFGDLSGDVPSLGVQVSALAVDTALAAWPHTYSEELRKRTSLIAPRHVKAAIEYIREHPSQITSPEYLARITGVSLRAMQYSFKNFTGQTISDYQKEVRLSGARNDIVQTSQSIRDIAQKWGFFSSGRFSAYFRDAYGVFPNELRRGEILQKEP